MGREEAGSELVKLVYWYGNEKGMEEDLDPTSPENLMAFGDWKGKCMFEDGQTRETEMGAREVTYPHERDGTETIGPGRPGRAGP